MAVDTKLTVGKCKELMKPLGTNWLGNEQHCASKIVTKAVWKSL